MVKNRNKFQAYLKNQNIETQVYYSKILPLMKSYKYLKHKKKDFLNAFNVSKKIISIPVSSHLTKKNLRFITNSIQEYLIK